MITTPHVRQPADFSDVRAANLAVVLRFITAHAPCSRADVAAATGLTKATVSTLVGELIERQLLREIGQSVRRVGRPATMIELDGSPYASIGLTIDVGRLTLVALDPAGRRLLSWRRAVPGRRTNVPGRTLAAAAALSRRAVTQLRAEGRQVLGLTVGVPGAVDEAGSVRLSPELAWQDVPARETLLGALNAPDFPVTVANSALLAARAEYRCGGHADAADLVYLTGTTRVLAGIIVDGSTLRGGLGAAGLIGHLPAGEAAPGADQDGTDQDGTDQDGTDQDGTDQDGTGALDACGCGCGRTDCLDAVATIAALVRRIDPSDPLSDLDEAVAAAVRKAQADDPRVLAVLADFGRRLGAGLALVADLLDPRVVVLGGHYATIAPWVAPTAEAQLRARATAARADGPRLVASTLGHEAAARGGAAEMADIVEIGRWPALVGPDRTRARY